MPTTVPDKEFESPMESQEFTWKAKETLPNSRSSSYDYVEGEPEPEPSSVQENSLKPKKEAQKYQKSSISETENERRAEVISDLEQAEKVFDTNRDPVKEFELEIEAFTTPNIFNNLDEAQPQRASHAYTTPNSIQHDDEASLQEKNQSFIRHFPSSTTVYGADALNSSDVKAAGSLPIVNLILIVIIVTSVILAAIAVIMWFVCCHMK